MKNYLPIFMEEDIKWYVPHEDECKIYIKYQYKYFKKLSIVSTPASFIPLVSLVFTPITNFTLICTPISKKYLKLIQQSDNPQYIYNCYMMEMIKKLEPTLTKEKTIDFLNDVGNNATKDKTC